MNLNNEDFFKKTRPTINSSGMIMPYYDYMCSGTFDFSRPSPYIHRKLYHTCEYCRSDVEIEAVRCNSCGAPKNSYKFKERNYNE